MLMDFHWFSFVFVIKVIKHVKNNSKSIKFMTNHRFSSIRHDNMQIICIYIYIYIH
jgi:hypothetical protein